MRLFDEWSLALGSERFLSLNFGIGHFDKLRNAVHAASKGEARQLQQHHARREVLRDHSRQHWLNERVSWVKERVWDLRLRRAPRGCRWLRLLRLQWSWWGRTAWGLPFYDLELIKLADSERRFNSDDLYKSSEYLILEECHPLMFELELENPEMLPID